MQKKITILKITLIIISLLLFISIFSLVTKFNSISQQKITSAVIAIGEVIKLPNPIIKSNISVEEAIYNRKSIRNFMDEQLSLKDFSQLLYSSQGITEGTHRVVPSAGALYPLEIYAAVEDVENITPGLYHYIPHKHSIEYIAGGSIKPNIPSIAYNQLWIKDSAADIIIAADYSRTESKYRKMAEKYVHMEVGHASQNVYLQAYALGLGTTIVGGFDNKKMKELMGIPYMPLAILPIGKPG